MVRAMIKEILNLKLIVCIGSRLESSILTNRNRTIKPDSRTKLACMKNIMNLPHWWQRQPECNRLHRSNHTIWPNPFSSKFMCKARSQPKMLG